MTLEKEFDPFESASNPIEKTYDIFGKVDLHAYACGLKKDLPPYDPQIHDRRYTAVKIYIQPLEEIEVKYPRTLECTWVAEFATWAKITWASIKACGFHDLREIKGKWARYTRVDSLEKPFEKTDMNGAPTGEMSVKKTFKFLAFYADEDACRAAYIAAGGQPVANGNNGSTPAPATSESENMLNFMKVIINKNVTKEMTLDEAKAIITAHQSYPVLSKFYTVDSNEVNDLLTQIVEIPF